MSRPPGANPRFSLLDLGNRHAKFGFPDGSCGARVQLDAAAPESSVAAFAAVCAAHAPIGPLLVASVAPRWWERLAPELRRAGAIVRSLTTADVPLRVLSQGTGMDRLLSAGWAHRAAAGPAVVASFGTAFTVDAVDGAGAFHGGAIGAGLGLQIAALAGAAPHLPPPDPKWQPWAIPGSSAEAIAAGTRHALALAVSALAEEYARRLNAAGCARFCTGGDAEVMAPLLGSAWRHEPDLVLRALADLDRR